LKEGMRDPLRDVLDALMVEPPRKAGH
jgi:hypothetical protein